MEPEFETKRPSVIPIILVGIAFVGSLGFLATVLLQSCERQPDVPRLRAGLNSDFNVGLANFLEKIPPKVRDPIVQCFTFLSQESLDPDFYKGKGLEDLKTMPLTNEVKFAVDGATHDDILNFTFSRFNEIRKETNLDLESKSKKLEGLKERLEKQQKDFVEFSKLNVTNIRHSYKLESVRVTMLMNFTLYNGSSSLISGFTYNIKFKSRNDGNTVGEEEKTFTFNDEMEPGESRPFFFRHNNFPNFANLPAERYQDVLEVIFSFDSAYLKDGTQIPPFNTPTGVNLEQTVETLDAEVKELEILMKKSENLLEFEFWRYLHDGGPKD